MSFKEKISSLHYRTGVSPLGWPLLLLEPFYRLAVSLRLFAYRQGWLKSHWLDIPIVSVGNLTTGGTGKTPIVIAIAKGLIKANKTVVILSRGYGAPEPTAYARALDPKYGDEAYLIQEQVPEAIVIVGRDRVQTLKRAIHDYRPDYVLLDDGFQYLRLQRNINILLIDGTRLLGNGHLLPAGPLREPKSEIQRADLIFITKSVNTEAMQAVEHWVKQYGPPPPSPPIQVIPVIFQPMGLKPMEDHHLIQNPQALMEALPSLLHRPVIAFSGVAQPAQFEQDIRSLGFHIHKAFRFADHHVYTDADVETIVSFAENCQERQEHGEPPLLLTTDKDLPKIRHLIPVVWHSSLYTLQMAPTLDGQWFYYEFLTQMPVLMRAGDGHVRSSGQ